MSPKGSDDYIRSTGRLAFVNLFLKYALFILGLVCLGLSITLVMISRRIGEVKTIPIVINEATGEATRVDFRTADATGEERKAVEIKYFVKEIIRDMYTFTKHTAGSNMDAALRPCMDSAINQIKAQIDMEERKKQVEAGQEGLVDVQAVNITQSAPNIMVQVYFLKKVLGNDSAAEGRYVATIRLKTIPRVEANPHGLVIVEYSQEKFKEAF